MPDIYIHYGVGSIESDGPISTDRVSVAADSIYSIEAHPKPGWNFSYADIAGVKYNSSPFSFTVPAYPIDVYLSFSQIFIPPTQTPNTPPTQPRTAPPTQPPSQPAPQPGSPGKGQLARIGTSCSIISAGGFGTVQFQVSHDRSGTFSGRYNSYSDAVDRANSTAACFEIPPPAPKTTDEIGQEVGILSQLINGALGSIQDIGQGLADLGQAVTKQGQDLNQAINGIWDKLEGWMIERILDIIWAALTRPKKET